MKKYIMLFFISFVFWQLQSCIPVAGYSVTTQTSNPETCYYSNEYTDSFSCVFINGHSFAIFAVPQASKT